MKKVLVDSRIPKKCADTLYGLGFELIPLPAFSALPAPVATHPDMLLFIAEKNIICHKDYLSANPDIFEKISAEGYDIITTDEEISNEYPSDILLNALHISDTVYCKQNSISHFIKDFVARKNLNICNVKQGYSKCSVCVVDDDSAITSDPSLCRAMVASGIDVLLISSGNITLSGYDTGFIGGCSGQNGDTVYFSGNILLHPDGEKIVDFCAKHKKTAVSLSEEPLLDIGSIFFI